MQFAIGWMFGGIAVLVILWFGPLERANDKISRYHAQCGELKEFK